MDIQYFSFTQFLGTFGLWFGWYGFNPGSTIQITTERLGDVASLVAVNTTLGAAAGTLSGLFTSTIVDERKTGVYQWDTTAAMNGCLTGLVAVTAGCATVEPWAGFVIGIVAGWVYLASSALILRFKIDDAVDAIPVHLFGGAWGKQCMLLLYIDIVFYHLEILSYLFLCFIC